MKNMSESEMAMLFGDLMADLSDDVEIIMEGCVLPCDETGEDLITGAGATSSKPIYVFPTPLTPHTSTCDVELNNRLFRLCNARDATGSLSPYLTIRDEVCSISIELNRRMRQPPRFRDFRKVKPVRTTTPSTLPPALPAPLVLSVDHVLSNDRKMIDLHWFHACGKRAKVEDLQFRDLFDVDDFDFELAACFLAKVWKTEVRVTKILGLSDVDQWQAASLMSDGVRKKWKEVLTDSRKVAARLKNLAHRKPALANHVEDFVLLWVADQICGGTPHHLVGQVYGWQKGALPLVKSTLSEKLVRMRKWTGLGIT